MLYKLSLKAFFIAVIGLVVASLFKEIRFIETTAFIFAGMYIGRATDFYLEARRQTR